MVLGITGASGRVGRVALDTALERYPADEIVATTRTPDALGRYRSAGVTVRFADFDEESSLDDAFVGIDQLVILSATNATGKRHEEHENAINAANRAGVHRIVFTSMLGVDRPNHPAGLSAQEYRAAEILIEASGIDHVILRNGPYTELNAVERMLPAIPLGRFRMNAGDGRSAFISRRDFGRAVVAAVRADLSGTVDLTGPALHNFTEVTDAIARLLGIEFRYESIDDETYRDELRAGGADELLTDVVSGTGLAIRTGYFGALTDTAEQLLGRPPVSLEQVLRQNEVRLRAAVGERLPGTRRG
jgi:NAD(P)H dehydrogenase (quinone)